VLFVGDAGRGFAIGPGLAPWRTLDRLRISFRRQHGHHSRTTAAEKTDQEIRTMTENYTDRTMINYGK
jgi:hypothetical protein